MKLQTVIEIRVEADVEYEPERPAPHAVDHDSPRFSDPGDDEVFEIGEMWFVYENDNGEEVKILVPEKMLYVVDKGIRDDLLDQCRDMR